VSAAWVFFRAQDFPSAFHLLQTMFLSAGGRALSTRYDLVMVLGLTAVFLAIHWTLRDSTLQRVVEATPWWLRGVGLAAAIGCLVLAPGDDRAFIYFQF
jgi:alginate O-acetyltransferase complex protein AlgI